MLFDYKITFVRKYPNDFNHRFNIRNSRKEFRVNELIKKIKAEYNDFDYISNIDIVVYTAKDKE